MEGMEDQRYSRLSGNDDEVRWNGRKSRNPQGQMEGMKDQRYRNTHIQGEVVNNTHFPGQVEWMEDQKY